ncbi:MAG: sulfotransferase [Paracoccaceae bacterium]
MPSTRRTFILGVGCQKGGTTWLHHYLKTHPQIAMPKIKELHVFDHRAMPGLFRTGIVKKHLRVLRLNPARITNLAMYYSDTVYLGHFERLWNGSAAKGNLRAVGEITPSYAILDAGQFAAIRDLLRGAGYDVHVIFLMRDPIDRIFSALRMVDRNKRLVRLSKPAAERFRAALDKPGVALRSRYDRTIRNLEAVFPPDRIFYGFYESLFCGPEISRLNRFLGTDDETADFGATYNATRTRKSLSTDDVAYARARYEETYRFCAEKFSEEMIARLWPNYLTAPGVRNP